LLECVKAQQYVEYDKFWKNYIYASFYACALGAYMHYNVKHLFAVIYKRVA